MQPVGVFDSGVGGLSVLRHVRALLPHEHLLYLADQAHVPYGGRPLDDIRRFSAAAVGCLHRAGAKLVIVACNTASAAALGDLRERFPALPIVGMEPAVKPAALQTRSGRVGVLATPHTFASPRYAALMARFAHNVSVWEDPCVGLVEQIEAGATDTPATADLLRGVLTPMLTSGVDTLVLGCTHYPFVRPLIEQVAAEVAPETAVAIIDPAPAVARQAARVLAQQQLRAPATQTGTTQLLTTGNARGLASQAQQLLGETFSTETAVWRDGHLIAAN